MRIELGPQAQVIGTKRVNSNGQIAGLKSFAGQDLLVVKAGDRAEYRLTWRDRAHQARVFLAEQARVTRDELQQAVATLRGNDGLRKTYEEYVEIPVKESVSKTRTWVEDQRGELEQRWESARQRLEAEIAQRRKQARDARKRLEKRVEGRRQEVEQAATELKRKLKRQVEVLGSRKEAATPTNGKKRVAPAAA